MLRGEVEEYLSSENDNDSLVTLIFIAVSCLMSLTGRLYFVLFANLNIYSNV